MQKLSPVQKMTYITAIADKKTMGVVCMSAMLCSNSILDSDQIIYLSCFYLLQDFTKQEKKKTIRKKIKCKLSFSSKM